MNVVVFEDRLVGQLSPIAIGRPAYAVSCGGYRLADWLARLSCPTRGIVRRHLTEVQRCDWPALHATPLNPASATLLVNARVAPSLPALRELQRLVSTGRPGVARRDGAIVAAILRPGAALPSLDLGADQWDDYLQFAGVGALADLEVNLALFDYPHDVLKQHLRCFGESLEWRLAQGDYHEVDRGVFLAPGASLGPYVVSDTKAGPVVLEEGATVGPHSFLRGPALLGKHCRVIEQAAIKDAVALGHTTKIGGEVEASIVEPYTNKQHHGFLGHSYLGSWINLGAGTCNSDLKNTYGEVKMEYGREKVATGMQFVGCIVGDYAKTAINTGIFTGKTIGACSMVYGFVTTNVPSFVNYARLFGQVTELSPEVMVATQQRMFARRRVEQRPCDVQLIHDMYALTQHERQLAGEPLSL